MTFYTKMYLLKLKALISSCVCVGGGGGWQVAEALQKSSVNFSKFQLRTIFA
jgi:hypothetical protein